MKRFLLLLAIGLSAFQLFIIQQSVAEGTKEIYPAGWGNYKFYLSTNNIRNDFALYGCPETERLNIQSVNVGEIIYYGFNDGANTNGFYYRIKDPDGIIVVPQTQIPTSGPGFIANLTQARIGPNTIYTGGYEPLVLVTAKVGSYYIEFTFGGSDKDFEFMDITVADPADTTEIPGRLWSKGWQLTTTGGQQQCGATMFVYADDQICTSVDFNGMRPYAFDISCNQTGCAQTGNFEEDRKSRPGRHLYPQYKIFLNDPDSIPFPTGVLGQIDSIAYETNCQGEVEFTIWVNKDGSAEILLDIYPPAGYNNGDVKLPTTVFLGSTGNLVSWDGLDGFGQPVGNGTTIEVTVSYLNGLTHLPIYDAEYSMNYNPNWTGYLVDLVRPSGEQPALFWDDSLCGGGSNLTGCVDPIGCHTWNYNQGNEKTINTWWYAVSTSSSPVTIIKKQDMTYDSLVEICQGDSILINGIYQKTTGVYPIVHTSILTGCDSTELIHLTVNSRPVVDLGADVWICEGFTHMFDAGAGTGYTYQWDNLTTGMTNIANTQTYTTGEQGFYKVTVNNPENCPNSDSVNLFVNPNPIVTNDPMSDTICSSSTFTLNLTSTIPGTDFSWVPNVVLGNITGATSGSGTTISHTLVNTEATNSILEYTITPVSGGCYGDDTIYTVVVKPKPEVTSTPLTYTLCSPDTITIALTSQVAVPSFGWVATASSGNVTGFSGGSGSTIHQGLTNTGYDIETVTYKVAATADGCLGDTVTFTVTLNPRPDLATTPLIQSQCNDLNTGITLTSNVSGTLFSWTATASSGNLSGQSNSVTPGTIINQLIHNSGTSIDTVYYAIVPQANSCIGDTAVYKVAVFPTPDLSNTPAIQAQCNGQSTALTLQSNVANTTFTWRAFATSGNLSGFSSNSGPGDTVINQILTNSGYAIDTVYYRLVPHANGCAGDSTDYKVAVYPTPDLSNSPAIQYQCNGQSTGLTLLSNVANTTFTWKAYTTSANISGFSDNTGPGVTTINQILVNSGYEIDTVIYRLLPSANNCTGDSVDYLVAVYPTPDLSNNPLVEAQCNNVQTNITLTSNVTNTTFTWRAFATSGNLSGFSSNTGPGTTQIDQTLFNSGYTTDTVYYRLLPTANNCTGDSTDFKVAVYPTPDLSNSPALQTQCNNQSTNLTLISNVANTTFTWRAFASSGNITGFGDNTGPGVTTIDQTLVNSGYSIDTVTYRLLPSANSCPGDSTDYQVVVFPTPDLSNTPAIQSQCNGQSTGLTLQSNVTGTAFTWRAYASSGNLSGYSGNSGPGSTTINQILFNSGYTIDTVTYRLMPMANNCSGDSVDYKVVVFPTPDLSNTPAIQAQCNGQSTALTLQSNVANTTFTWRAFASSVNITGFSDNAGAGVTTIDQILINSGYDIDTVTYRLVPMANNCTGDSVDYQVVVFPTPDLSNNPVVQSQCNNQNTGITLTSNVANTVFTWSCAQPSGNVTGWVENPGPGTTSINQTLILSGWVADSLIYHITPHANNCDGLVADYKVYVNPIPELTVSPMFDSICSEELTNINLTSTVLGTDYTWIAAQGAGNINGFSDGSGSLIAQQLFNPDPAAGSVLYTITPATGNCTGLDTTFTQWVKPLPHLTNLPKGDSICSNTGPNVTLTSDVTNTWFTWTVTGSSLLITGFSDQATPTTLLNQTLTNLGFDIEWATYQVTPTAAGCQGPDSAYVVTVYPVPDMSNNPPDTAICNGEPTGVTLTSNVSGTLFTWTAAGSSANVTGFTNNAIPTVILDQTLVNTGDDIETVTYTITPSANGCDGADTSFVVTVYPIPDLSTTPLAKEICNNNNTDITLTSNVTGTLFTWTAYGSSANITGYNDNTNPATLIDDNLINLGDVNETVTYRIVPHANGCDGDTSDYVVTVVPSPYLTNNPLDSSICNGQPTGLSLQSNVAGTQFSWTCTPSSSNVTGYSNSMVPDTLIDQVLFNSGFDNETVTYHITPENSGCPGSVTDYTFTVFPVPDVYFIPNGETLCEGEVSNLSLQSHVTGTTFTWTATPSSPNLTGYSDGSGDLIAQTISNSGATIEWVTYQATPTANGCPPGTTMPVVLTVNPRPAVTNPVTSFSQCNNATTAITLQADVTGPTFAWRAFASSTNLAGFNNGTGSMIVQTLTNTGYTIDSVTYRVAATANGCTGDSTDFIVVVFPVADVIFTPNGESICSGQVTNLSLQSNVIGTTFSWTATGSSPAVTGYGNGSGDLIQDTLYNSGYMIPTVTYQVTPTANGCVGTPNSVVATVNPLPVVSLTICYDTLLTTESQPFTLKGGNPPGGTFTGTGVNNGRFFPALADTGRHTITYYYANTYGCDGIDSIHITILEPVLINCGDTLIDIRDNRIYPTVEIGTQCWMATNLNYGIVIASSQVQRDNCIPEKYCINDNPANCTAYGGLYQWNEMMQYTTDNGAQAFCPPGWHLPTEADWNTLFNFYISNGFAGSALKLSGYSGFNALLEGIRFHNSVWRFRASDPLLRSSIFWSSTRHGPEKAWAHGMNEVVVDIEYTPSVSFYPAGKINAFLGRCLKD